MKRVMVGMVVVAGLGLAGDAEARLLSRRDAVAIADQAAQRVVVEDVEAIHTMLSAQGMSEREIDSTAQRLVNRLVRDVRSYANGLEGRSFPTIDDAERDVREKWMILRFSAINAPHIYAQGRPMTYRVTEGEAKRMERSLMATWIEREPLLRKKLDELMDMNELTPTQSTAVRQWTRKLALVRGRSEIQRLIGATFFSAADADYFLECAIVAEIEAIRSDRLADPILRPAFVEEAMVEYGAIEDGAVVGDVRRSARPATFETAQSSGPSEEIDFNK